MVQPVPQVHLQPDLKVSKESKEQPVQRDRKESKDPKETKAFKEQPVPPDRKESKAFKESTEPPEQLDPPAQPELQDPPARQVQREPRVQREQDLLPEETPMKSNSTTQEPLPDRQASHGMERICGQRI
jgi:hypothetical protein